MQKPFPQPASFLYQTLWGKPNTPPCTAPASLWRFPGPLCLSFSFSPQTPEPNSTALSSPQGWAGAVRMDTCCLCLIQGAGTCDGTLIRIIVSRCEIDLNLIKYQFNKMYGKTLSSMIMVSQSSSPTPGAGGVGFAGRPGCCDRGRKYLSSPSGDWDITLVTLGCLQPIARSL